MRIELTYKGFADLSLTTWVPRRSGDPCSPVLAVWGGVPDIKVASCEENVYWPGGLAPQVSGSKVLERETRARSNYPSPSNAL